MLSTTQRIRGTAIKNARAVSLVGLLILAASALLIAGCGRGNGAENAASQSTATATREPTETPFPTWTPAPSLPETSSVSLEPAHLTQNGQWPRPDGLFIADASTGEVFWAKTQPGPTLYPQQWVSPTRLVVYTWNSPDSSYYLLDLDAKSLRRLSVSADEGAVSFSHAIGLMTSTVPNGELIISSIADNREVARIANGPTAIANWSPYVQWAPDDKHIFFRSANSTSGTIASVEPTPVIVPAETPGDVGPIAWTPDGRAVVFANTDGIFSIDATSGQTTRLYSWPAGINVVAEEISLSPDGEHAFVALSGGPQRDALIVPLNGRTQGSRITYIEMSDTAWSSANDLLAVIADRCTPDSRLLLVNADGSLRATIAGAGFIPRFSEDGSVFAYVGNGPPELGMQGQWGTTVRNAADGTLVSFAAGFPDDNYWSPDGRWLADTPNDIAPYTDSCASGLEKTEILPFP
jgi:hypothetical protein